MPEPALTDSHCHLNHPDFADDVPTRDQWDPSASAFWSTPGGKESPAEEQSENTLAGHREHLVSALQAMVDGQVSSFLFIRQGEGYESVLFSAEVVVESELNPV